MTAQSSPSPKTALIALVLTLIIAGIALALHFAPQGIQTRESTAASTPVPAPAAPVVKVPVKPAPSVDLTSLAERAAAPPALTQVQAQEEEETEEAQVAQARVWLESLNPEERVQGAEQLAAYPTREAEKLLVHALVNDAEAEVRNTAAMSLGYVEKPSEETIHALLAAVEDADEEVSINALSTLEDYLLNEEEGSPGYKKLLGQLKSKAHSHSLSQETRETLKGILEDLHP